MSTMHQELFPAFYSDVQPVELPELTFRDVENLAAQDDETEQAFEAQPEPIEEVEEQQPAPRLARFKDAHDHKQRMWAEHDARMDAELASVRIPEYKDRFQCAFHKVIDQRTHFLNRSTVRVQQYSDSGHGSRKASAPNRMDYIADSELVSKSALKGNPKLLRVFLNHMGTEFEFWSDVPGDVRVQIEQTVGRAYIRAGLHPTSRYFA
jgi:hypothetical protein